MPAHVNKYEGNRVNSRGARASHDSRRGHETGRYREE